MCGIVGFCGSGNPEVLTHLVGQLHRRGPDGEGVFIDQRLRVYIGHRRLAIRDLQGGAQPMLAGDDRYVLSYNGEIYNDLQLRQELQLLGHKFISRSDTEVVLRSLMQWGKAALKKFDGQFALCFLDRKDGSVLLARDRFGEKPLFWARISDGIVFASESNVLAQHPSFQPRLDEENCIRFLIMGYLPPPFSILQGVRQLIPGHYLSYSLFGKSETNEAQFAAPWQHSGISLDTHSNLDIDVLKNAVISRSVSDTAPGILLSGGVDSSLVAYAAKQNGARPETFTIGFCSSSYDESAIAKGVADEFGFANHNRTLNNFDGSRVEQVLGTLDEPLGDPSYLPSFEIFELAKLQSRVLLTGDGADELFFGYEPFRAIRAAQVLRRIVPKFVADGLHRFLSAVPRTASYMNRIDVAERFLDGLHYKGAVQVLVWMSNLRVGEWHRFFLGKPCPDDVFSFAKHLTRDLGDEESVRRLFLTSYLPGSVLAKSDQASMANGTEARAVFFYPGIVSRALQLTLAAEVKRGQGKQTLRRIAAEAGLAAVASRAKHGFALPVSAALRNSGLDSPQIKLASLRQDILDEEWRRMSEGIPARFNFLWSALALSKSKSYRLASR